MYGKGFLFLYTFLLLLSHSDDFRKYRIYTSIFLYLCPLNSTSMDKRTSAMWRLELLWWLLTALVVVGLLYPILRDIKDYPFLVLNIVFIVTSITFARYIFLLKHTFIAKRQWAKVVLVFLCIPIILYLVNGINYFQTFLDEKGIESFMSGIDLEKQYALVSYIRNEMIFFGVGSLISAIIMPFRLLISVWRLHNRGTI